MKKLIKFFTKLCEAYLPDAFVFCLILTLLTFVAALFLTPHSSLELVSYWGKEFWSLNTFAMQMVFVLLTGHMLATTPAVRRAIKSLTTIIRHEKMALVILSLCSTLACWLNWGFGLIVGGILAIEFSRKLGKVNFGLFIATAYSGFLVWHGGLSGSIPLKIAGRDEILSRVYPDLSIPLSQSIFSHWNLTIIFILLLIMPLMALWMRTDEKVVVNYQEIHETEERKGESFREIVEGNRFFNIIFFLFFMIIIVNGFKKEETLDINRVNLFLLAFSLLFHRTPKKFLQAIKESITFTSDIIIQFPFYAGLMGLMQHSGLADQIAQIFIQISTPQTLPLWSFLSGGIINFFIPSGGGQWVVQGPIVLKAAKELSVDPAKVSMALAWGDAWTNLIQPFFALPLLALAGLKLKDIMGHCLIFVLVSGLAIGSVLYFS